jgi:hypothetical protein
MEPAPMAGRWRIAASMRVLIPMLQQRSSISTPIDVLGRDQYDAD